MSERMQFSVVVVPGDDVHEESLVVTCERCGLDIPDRPPLVIVKLKGEISPQQFESFRQQWLKVSQQYRSWRNAPIVDAQSVDIQEVGGNDLRAAMIEHASVCTGVVSSADAEQSACSRGPDRG